MNNMQPQKGSATIIAFIILLFTLGGTVWYFKNVPVGEESAMDIHKQPINNPLPQTEENKTISTQTTTNTKWKVFKDKRYSFQFEYPSEWGIEDASESEWGLNGGGIILKNEKGDDTVYVNVYMDMNAREAKESTSRCKMDTKSVPCEILKTSSGAIVAVDWGTIGMSNAPFVSKNETQGVNFSVEEPDADTKTIFKKILSTFEFIQ